LISLDASGPCYLDMNRLVSIDVGKIHIDGRIHIYRLGRGKILHSVAYNYILRPRHPIDRGIAGPQNSLQVLPDQVGCYEPLLR